VSEFRLKPGTRVVADPTKSSFTTDEDVKMYVRATIQARELTPPFGTWLSRTRVYSGGKQIGTDKQIHSYSGADDEVVINSLINCGKFSAGTLSGYATAEG